MLHFLKRSRVQIKALILILLSCLILILVVSVGYIRNEGFAEKISNLHEHISKHVLKSITSIKNGNINHMDPSHIHIDKKVYGSYSELFQLLAKSKPNCKPLTQYVKDNHNIQKFPKDNVKFNKDLLENLLILKNDDKLKLFESYETFVSGLHNLSLDVFGTEVNKPIEGNGVVIVGGGKFSWLTLLNIHQLRKTGSNLPVEVYIPSPQDYDPSFCNEILPMVNSRCILGYEELPLKQVYKAFKLKTFEYKILAILTSSFENVLMLDADNLLLTNPDRLFNWDLYLKKQLILWPDCWMRTTNPFLFDLLHIDVDYSNTDSNINYDVHELPGSVPNPSTESGMLLVNKRSHVNTLLLALYMNVYGSDYYYPLLTQGGSGQGDKDSYIMAAYALEESVYQVKQDVVFLGRYPESGFVAGGLGQCDPMTEKEKYVAENNILNEPCDEFMFIHLSNPKYFPDEITPNFRDENGNDFREFEDSRIKYDFELQVWEIMCQLLCQSYQQNKIVSETLESSLIDPKFRLSAQSMSYIKSMRINKICDIQLLPHLQFLRSNPVNR
jgi:alpha 1,2-mannosyltransferase